MKSFSTLKPINSLRSNIRGEYDKFYAFIAPILYAAGFVLGIPESIKLAKAFGKSTFVGVLMAIPGIKEISRLILGVSKAKYQRLAS